jgi:uncharacterized integral membrane protein (TIGR00698 family)
MKNIKELLPGILLSLGIALLATGIEALLPVHVVGAAVLAMFIGIGIRSFWHREAAIKPGVQFTSKKILKLAIILLGASLNVGIVLEVGGRTLLILCFTLLTAFGGGLLLGKLLGVNWKLSNMIAAGTGICGGSAIAAVAPVIDADDSDVTYAISATFLFDMAMVVLFPIMGRALQLSDVLFGFWTGTSVNDTSSVVATSFAFSEAAGEIATMVKLTRTLAIIPTVIFFAFLAMRKRRKESNEFTEELSVSVKGLFPWFIVWFVGMAALHTVGVISPEIAELLRTVSRFLMVVALAAIGLKTDLQTIKQTGIGPFIHGVTLSSLVVVVSIIVTIWFVA